MVSSLLNPIQKVVCFLWSLTLICVFMVYLLYDVLVDWLRSNWDSIKPVLWQWNLNDKILDAVRLQRVYFLNSSKHVPVNMCNVLVRGTSPSCVRVSVLRRLEELGTELKQHCEGEAPPCQAVVGQHCCALLIGMIINTQAMFIHGRVFLKTHIFPSFVCKK